MKVKQLMKINETRIHITDSDNNLVAECPEKFAPIVAIAINKYDALKASHEKLVEFVKYVSLIDAGWVSDPDNENPLSMGELQRDANQALAEAEKVK